MSHYSKIRLLATAAPLTLALAVPAWAQQGSTVPADATQVPGANGQQTPSSVAIEDQRKQDTASTSSADQAEGDIVVTGSLFRGNAETPSPVTTLTAANLEQRGINTVTEAIQRLSANGAGTLPNNFSSNGAFASGASAPSLRGLTTSSTLVLFDGLRMAYYPLADDGTRNFVDINSIPNAIIDRIDVLKDGASSTYGADAVAGVINVITKKQITGLRLNASAGTSQKGDASEQRLDATFGYGDLSENRFNAYVSGEYQKTDALFARQRGYPFNTSDLSGLCAPSVGVVNQTTGATIIAPGTRTCRTNNVVNGTQFDGSYAALGTTTVPVVRPFNALNTAAIPGGRYQLLNGAAGCGALPTIQLTAAQAASAAGATAALTNCAQDTRNLYNYISPNIERIGGSGRLTVQLGEDTQAYFQGNFYQSRVTYGGTPQAIRFASPNGGATINGALPTSANLALPVYVCPLNGQNATFVNSTPGLATGCTATTPGARLNPNNPFAAAGQTARILTLLPNIPVYNERLSRSYRAAGGIDGSFGGGFDYSLEGIYSRVDLKATYRGYPNLQNLFNVVADGSYNFVNPATNSQATNDYLAPARVNNSRSELAQVQGSVRKQFFDLPGGPLGVAVGAAYRREEVISPSANPANARNPFDTVNINRFGTSGSRNVKSAYFEINAPIFEQLLINGSGRYDKYSSGQHNFSPKVGGKFTPIKQVSFVGTYSRGFRIPSFAESFGLPTTGFIQGTPPTSYQSACANSAPAGAAPIRPAYCTAQYSIGLTSVGNPNLKPEKSRNITAGVILNPVRNVSLRVDYYNITKKNLITGADYSPQIAAYYANNGNVNILTPGIDVVTQDTVGFANLAPGQAPFPLINTVQYGFINADSAKSEGVDASLETSYDITDGIRWTSSLEANYVIELSQTIGGVKQEYQDSLGPYQTTSASGTPQWRGSWQNTFDFGTFSITGTAYYTGGYSEGASDDGNLPDGQTCYTSGINGSQINAGGAFALYRDGNTVVACRVKRFIYGDVTASFKVNDQFTLYANILNVTNEKPPYDPSTYGAGSGANIGNYNPAWGTAGILGRYFRVGARVKY